jgi:hypothetical protein
MMLLARIELCVGLCGLYHNSIAMLEEFRGVKWQVSSAVKYGVLEWNGMAWHGFGLVLGGGLREKVYIEIHAFQELEVQRDTPLCTIYTMPEIYRAFRSKQMQPWTCNGSSYGARSGPGFLVMNHSNCLPLQNQKKVWT